MSKCQCLAGQSSRFLWQQGLRRQRILRNVHPHTRRRVQRRWYEQVSIQFGTGAAKTLTSGFETFTLEGQTFIRSDHPDSWRFRVTENFTANFSDSFSLGPVLIYQVTDYAGEEGKVQWVSAGARPIWHFNQRISLALEAGIDWVKDDER